jgi:hypothetical protein
LEARTPPEVTGPVLSSQTLTAIPVLATRSKQLSPRVTSNSVSPLVLPLIRIRFSRPIVRGLDGTPGDGRGGSNIDRRAEPMSLHLFCDSLMYNRIFAFVIPSGVPSDGS